MHNSADLSHLFASAGQAVIGTDGERIVFANPRAKAELGFDPERQRADSVIPREVLECNAESFVCAASVAGRSAGISVTRYETLTILFLDFTLAEKPAMYLTRNIMTGLRNSMTSLKLSVDRCCRSIGEGLYPDEKYTAILYHHYYCLLRTLEQVDSADLLERGELPFTPVATDLVKLCGELTDSVIVLSANLNIAVRFETTETELFAAVDPVRMEQLLLNLFANSLQHTKAGGHVTLSLGRREGRIVLSLDDDGDGFPQEKLPGIFNLPDDTQEPGNAQDGLGLGLCIASGIARLHGGVLLIESRKDEGSHVRVMLPADGQEAPKFKSPQVEYRIEGPGQILTGLAEVLPTACFGPKYED